jgi:hypothetical protein
MTPELQKATSISLRSLGLDEKWLQDKILADPSLLGLGDLEVAGREHHQPQGGRIDFLMRDTEEEVYYEVEVMLGALDESHIIRTIEYWDIERQRRPQWDHRAVIVAEEITARFFNVLRLLNRAVPLIAVKLSSFQLGEKIVLHPVTVLNIIQESSDPDTDVVEQKDRAYWEKKSQTTLSVMDKIVAALRSANVEPRLTYNQGHIAMGSTGRNFCWFHPRKSPGTAHIDFRTTTETRDSVLAKLQEGSIDATPRRTDIVTFNITTVGLDAHLDLIKSELLTAESQSK